MYLRDRWVTFSKQGFNTETVSDLYLGVNTIHTENAQLAIGQTSTTVDVVASGSAVSLDTNDATVGNNFDVNMVHELPLQVQDNPMQFKPVTAAIPASATFPAMNEAIRERQKSTQTGRSATTWGCLPRPQSRGYPVRVFVLVYAAGNRRDERDPENGGDPVADVVGYSRLAGADEDRTLARLRALRSDLIDPTIAVHHGRVVKRTGDGSDHRVPQRRRRGALRDRSAERHGRAQRRRARRSAASTFASAFISATSSRKATAI